LDKFVAKEGDVELSATRSETVVVDGMEKAVSITRNIGDGAMMRVNEGS
jgi:hypothetical protein